MIDARLISHVDSANSLFLNLRTSSKISSCLVRYGFDTSYIAGMRAVLSKNRLLIELSSLEIFLSLYFKNIKNKKIKATIVHRMYEIISTIFMSHKIII